MSDNLLPQLLVAFGILAICVLIHISGLMILADRLKPHISADNDARLWRGITVLIVAFAVIVILHTLETMVWAVFYQVWQLFSNFETSLYFSLTSYTTIGFGDVVLPDRWRLLGGIEGITGILLSGLSAAFLFVIVGTIQQSRTK